MKVTDTLSKGLKSLGNATLEEAEAETIGQIKKIGTCNEPEITLLFRFNFFLPFRFRFFNFYLVLNFFRDIFHIICFCFFIFLYHYNFFLAPPPMDVCLAILRVIANSPNLCPNISSTITTLKNSFPL